MSIARYEPTPAPARAGHVTVTERDIALIERQAAILARSSIVPLNNAADIAMVGMKALSLGVDPMAAFDDIYVIPSKGGPKLTISARMRVALARRAGCEVWFAETTDEAATCCLRRSGESRVHQLTYTVEQARRAGLTGDNWAKHPAAMLRAAAARQLVNLAAQDVLLGIGGMGDVGLGGEFDPVDVPDDVVGYSGQEALEAAPEPEPEREVRADSGDVDRLRAVISHLTAAQQEWLRGRMRAAHIPPLSQLPARLVGDMDLLVEAAAEFDGTDGEEAGQ